MTTSVSQWGGPANQDLVLRAQEKASGIQATIDAAIVRLVDAPIVKAKFPFLSAGLASRGVTASAGDLDPSLKDVPEVTRIPRPSVETRHDLVRSVPNSDEGKNDQV